MPDPATRIRELAHAEGFALVGFAPVEPAPDAPRYAAFLDEKRHGDMAYLERFRDRILDPTKVAPGARTMICLAVNHARPAGGFRGGGRVARYALGRDYHAVVDGMLRRLERRLRAEGLGTRFRGIVDAGPILERSHAARAGIGFLSKSANLLHHKYGPWLFLGELLTDLELEATPVRAPGSCGTCTLCVDRCPTGAITEPGRVDARICISYLTIELRGSIPEPLRRPMGEWVFGCDVCSEVCPFGDGAPSAADRFGTHGAFDLRLEDLLTITEEEFARTFQGSPLRRTKRAGLARNAAIVLGNLGRTGAVPILRRAAERDPAEAVAEAAAWALAEIEHRR